MFSLSNVAALAVAVSLAFLAPPAHAQSTTYPMELAANQPQPFVLCDIGLANSPVEPVVWDESHAPLVLRVPKSPYGVETAAVEITHSDRVTVQSWGFENRTQTPFANVSQQYTFLWQLSIRPQPRAPFTTLLDSPLFPGTPPGATYAGPALNVGAWDGNDDFAGSSGDLLPGSACTLNPRVILITDPAVIARFRLAARSDPGYVHIAVEAFGSSTRWFGDPAGAPVSFTESGFDGHSWRSGCRATLSITGTVRYIRAQS